MPTDPRGPIVILGAGPAGLGAAWRLHQSGFDNWVLVERSGRAGGLAASYVDEHGFTWDLGGHVLFSHYPLFTDVVDSLLGPEGWVRHQRESWVRSHGCWIPYPFQNNIHRLPPAQRDACLQGILDAARNPAQAPASSFAEFSLRALGRGLFDIFVRPYNTKVWACAPEDLSCEWIDERVSLPDASRVAENVRLNRDDVSWGPNRVFRFPLRGGTGAIWSTLASRLPRGQSLMNREAVAIDPAARVVTLAGGERLAYETLISTIPLDRLAAVSGAPAWRQAARSLVHSALHIFGLALRGTPPAHLASKRWMLFPEPDFPCFRVTHFSSYSPNNTPPDGRFWSLMGEVSVSAARPMNEEDIDSRIIRGLLRDGLVESPEQVHHVWRTKVEHAYPTPTLGRRQALDALLPDLAKAGILSRGRFGAWKYEVGNMDHSFMQGVEAADLLLTGAPERTVWNPKLVNATPQRQEVAR